MSLKEFLQSIAEPEKCQVAEARERVLRDLVSTLKMQQKQADENIELAEERCRKAEQLAAIRLKTVTVDEERKARQARRESAAALKNAKIAERQRSVRQQKLAEQERKREQLKRKIIESAEEVARREVEEIKQQAIAEALALKSRAKAKAKAMRTDAHRLRGCLLASAKDEAQRLREQALQEAEELKRSTTEVSPEAVELPQDTDLLMASPVSQDENEKIDMHARKQPSHNDDDDDSAFESACEWEVLNELTAKVDEEDDSWVIG